MSIHTIRAAGMASLVGLACLATTGCGSDTDSAETPSTADAPAKTRPGRGRPEEQTPAIPVAVAQVRRGLIEAFYQGSTNLSAAGEAVVVARTQGVVEALFAEEGDVVTIGQPLAQLDTERLALELARSEAQLERLKTAYERAERMFEAKMISPNDFDDAKYAFTAEETNLQLRQYELREATIRATIDGVVTRRHIKVGHTLNQNTPAFEMKRLDVIEAELNVPEREIVRIRPRQSARVRIDALPDEKFTGEVLRVAPEVDPTSGTFRVTVALANTERQLKPGMFARIDVRIDARPDALLVPLAAVVTRRDRSSVFVVQGATAERRIVATGYFSDGNVEILDGVDEGEWVVTTGQEGLRDGVSVLVVEGQGPTGAG